MILSGKLVAPSTSASPTSIAYVNDPFKGDFSPADKHGASFLKTATEPLSEKDRFSLNPGNANKVFHLIKYKASIYFWDSSIIEIYQSYPIKDEHCTNLLLSSNRVPLNSVLRDAFRCWAKKTAICNETDFMNYIMRPPHLGIATINPSTSQPDKSSIL